ncbi:unnamed protein product [Spirodela intermedia]|uniref:Dof zinc finger protein n=1 Tax=Spirodela intermedia TaxID=51605 RepID=A0A7I8IK67_SPIIN|nr:unnamed protein product [Spirodela intermedia]CAA6657763.1 unnamed protein product [Spirodela intermedia]
MDGNARVSSDGRERGIAAGAELSACGGEAERCPRCGSQNTKFCYYNNYNLAQPRHFCKACRRYWTVGGSLRNVPVGGSTRRAAAPQQSKAQVSPDRPISSPPKSLRADPLLLRPPPLRRPRLPARRPHRSTRWHPSRPRRRSLWPSLRPTDLTSLVAPSMPSGALSRCWGSLCRQVSLHWGTHFSGGTTGMPLAWGSAVAVAVAVAPPTSLTRWGSARGRWRLRGPSSRTMTAPSPAAAAATMRA